MSTYDFELDPDDYSPEPAHIANPRKALIDAAEKLRVQATAKPIAYLAWRDGKPAWDREDCICEDAVYPTEADDRCTSMPLYTHPAPDHTALLRQALEALDDSRDDVCECLNMVMEHAGYERYDKRIAAYQKQLAKHDAAIAAIEGALK